MAFAFVCHSLIILEEISLIFEASCSGSEFGKASTEVTPFLARFFFIVFISKNSIVSDNVKREISYVSSHILINPFSKFDYSEEIEKITKLISIYPDWI